MGRNSKDRQTHAANELLGFHFSTPAGSRQDNPLSSSSNSRGPREHGNNRVGGRDGGYHQQHRNDNRRRNRQQQQQQNQRDNRSAQDRASARRKAHATMFYLHSSAEHAFLLTRKSPYKVHKESSFSFQGADESVSWESVRMVRQLVPVKVAVGRSSSSSSRSRNKTTNNVDDDALPTCPICLCDFVCPRITKCGHSFCLPCIIRHVQTHTANNPYTHVKCPCCGIPIILDDLRPVIMESVTPPIPDRTIRLRKLHRQKLSSSPYLPQPDEPMHSNPHFAPTAGVDSDARYSRFNYLDPPTYHASLVANQGELQREIKALGDPNTVGSNKNDHYSSNIERIYLSMALEMVLAQQQQAQTELADETELMTRFSSPGSGHYQRQPTSLVYNMDHDGVTTRKVSGAEIEDNQCNTVSDSYCHTSVDAGLDAAGLFHEQSGDVAVRRYRGDSISSYKSMDSVATPLSQIHNPDNDDNVNDDDDDDNNNKDTPNSPVSTVVRSGPCNSPSRRKSKARPRGSMYLDEEKAVNFYQAEDGQLIFLNGFNMTCLLSDYSRGPPPTFGNTEHNVPTQPPLPDWIEGRVLEIEKVHLTADVRKRMPVFSHIPLYCDINFVELDLNHILTEATRRKFKVEFAKRRQRRQSKVEAEKRADRAAEREEMERINERKARLQTINPDDEFFRVAPAVTVGEDVMDPESFGPVLGSNNSNTVSTTSGQQQQPAAPPISFSEACRRGHDSATIILSDNAFPSLGGPSSSSSRSEAFPALGSSGSTTNPSEVDKKPSGAVLMASNAPSGGKKTKKKGQKLVLFSTGGQRGY